MAGLLQEVGFFTRIVCCLCVGGLISSFAARADHHSLEDMRYPVSPYEDVRIHKKNPIYDGFYFGVRAGLSSSHTKVSLETREVSQELSVELKKDKQQVNYALVLGYGQLLDPHNIYLGLETDFSLGGGAFKLESRDGSHSENLKREHHVGVSVLMGLGKEAWLLYGLVGFKSSRFKVETVSPHVSSSREMSSEAVRLGGGLALALNHDIFLRSDYNYLKYGKLKSEIIATPNLDQIQQKVRLTATRDLSEHVITLGIFYHF